MHLTKVMVVSSNKESIPKKMSLHIQQSIEILHNKNIQLLKKNLAIILCISKFQSDLLNQKFFIRVDCKSAKEILQKDVKNLALKQIFARWKAILSVFNFEIEYLKDTSNSLPDYLILEFLQKHCHAA